mmetsp:Transcript_28682/g.65534  ORF Transcript_28682/g.65534 Transcript_28682/m.65534 type:complete len:229 (-) Transcript_28682:921-1607(-)
MILSVFLYTLQFSLVSKTFLSKRLIIEFDALAQIDNTTDYYRNGREQENNTGKVDDVKYYWSPFVFFKFESLYQEQERSRSISSNVFINEPPNDNRIHSPSLSSAPTIKSTVSFEHVSTDGLNSYSATKSTPHSSRYRASSSKKVQADSWYDSRCEMNTGKNGFYVQKRNLVPQSSSSFRYLLDMSVPKKRSSVQNLVITSLRSHLQNRYFGEINFSCLRFFFLPDIL